MNDKLRVAVKRAARRDQRRLVKIAERSERGFTEVPVEVVPDIEEEDES